MPPERGRRRGSVSGAAGARAYRSPEVGRFQDGGAPRSPFLAIEADFPAPSGFMPADLFQQIHERYAGRMQQIAGRITRNPADAEDAVQDALLRIYEKYGTFRHESSLWTWVYRVTQTSALMILKKRRAQRRIAQASRETVACREEMSRPLTPEHALFQSRTLGAVRESVDLLIPSLRHLMRSYLKEDLNQKELCERHGLTLLATKARMHRARVLLRRRLASHLLPESAAGNASE